MAAITLELRAHLITLTAALLHWSWACLRVFIWMSGDSTRVWPGWRGQPCPGLSLAGGRQAALLTHLCSPPVCFALFCVRDDSCRCHPCCLMCNHGAFQLSGLAGLSHLGSPDWELKLRHCQPRSACGSDAVPKAWGGRQPRTESALAKGLSAVFPGLCAACWQNISLLLLTFGVCWFQGCWGQSQNLAVKSSCELDPACCPVAPVDVYATAERAAFVTDCWERLTAAVCLAWREYLPVLTGRFDLLILSQQIEILMTVTGPMLLFWVGSHLLFASGAGTASWWW